MKGFLQKYGIDYSETFAPVARMSSIRIILAVAVEKKMHVHQMEVKTAFLNGDLEEEIYVEQPEGYEDPEKPDYVCNLKKSLYGLKQAHREWHKKIDDALVRLGFSSCSSDRALYVKFDGVCLSTVTVYVDDLVIASDDLSKLSAVKKSLGETFEMKDLGVIDKVLGIQAKYDRENGWMSLSQELFVSAILKRFKMKNSKTMATPMEERGEMIPKT